MAAAKEYEVDIFEWYGDFKTHVGHSVHTWNEEGSQGDGHGGGFGPIPGGDATNSWHIYGCRVDPQWIIFYIDGFESKGSRRTTNISQSLSTSSSTML
jgi:Glycosyl hydrolases family 16